MNYDFTTVKINGGGHVVAVTAEKQADIALLFLRMQEFYESPFDNIRGRKFTLEEYMDTYCAVNDDFDYTYTYAGFNVPGHRAREFFEIFADDLLDKEKVLRDKLRNIVTFMDKFSLVGYPKNLSDCDVLPHELAHTFYYLDPDYRREMRTLNSELSDKVAIYLERHLEDWGYVPQVFEDEIQAYIATSPKGYLDANFDDKKLNKLIYEKCRPKYRKVFDAVMQNNPGLKALIPQKRLR